MTFFHRSKRRPEQPAAQGIPAGLPHEVARETRRYLPHSPYLLPKDQQEACRLDFQHHALLHAIGSLSVAPIPLDTGMILDVGSGTGIWAVEMARQFPNAQVIGVDIDPALFKRETPQNCTLRVGDVLSRLPFPDQLFAYTHQRLLRAAIPAQRWPGVVRELVRVTRAGGWVEIVELDDQVHPAGPASLHLQSWMDEVSRGMGFDGEVIRHLGELLQEAGLHAVEVQRIVMPLGEWGGWAACSNVTC